MKVKNIHFKHFRRFSDFSLQLHKQLTVLVARNGAGKTSILDGIAICLGSFLTYLPDVSGINFKATDFQLLPSKHGEKKPPYMRLTCALDNGIVWDRTEKRDGTTKTIASIPSAYGTKSLKEYADTFTDALNEDASVNLPIIIYYDTARAVFDSPQRKRNFKKTFRRLDAFQGALSSRANFKSFIEYFYALEAKESKKQKEMRSFEVEIPELKAIRRAIHTMIPEFSNPVTATPASIAVDWTHDGTTETLLIEQFSDGYRTTLAMVMDIAARMAEANPDMEDPLQTEGIVIIDEIELHLHPGWQQTILLDLMRTFPNIQFIISTHSPQIVSSVKPESLRVIDWHDNIPQIEDVHFSEGAEAQKMLQDVLGVKNPRVESLAIVQELKEYQGLVENNAWDSERGLALLEKLIAWGGEHEPELARLAMDVRIKDWERSQS